jgi:hypothetical protein
MPTPLRTPGGGVCHWIEAMAQHPNPREGQPGCHTRSADMHIDCVLVASIRIPKSNASRQAATDGAREDPRRCLGLGTRALQAVRKGRGWNGGGALVRSSAIGLNFSLPRQRCREQGWW